MASKTDYHKTYIKICGLFRPEDIFYVNEARPDYAGFIINFEKSHRNVSSDTVVSLKNLLLQNNITIKSCDIILSRVENNGIIIASISIYIDKEFVRYTNLVSSIVYDNFGITPNIMTE